ncbi:MAG: DUF5318 family protein, partial [Actinomycetota bacterium]
HPELIRAARNLGEETSNRCEVCAESNVVLLTYVFGHSLPRHGRLITERSEIAKLQRTGHDYAAYVVEVCPSCRWHHLLRMLPIVGQRRTRMAR